ncbi:T9SS type A sorting domain-containing protein [Winogradskyella schleiferi]|uniref:T9SS type A sorting domain-containing protein n=1 Tax=Winogradskyella schleiferi TaxID=2686078 RepID=UPI0015B7E20A|nr:T9SS type A sorting domain-containing protein [Winogradskyella schleiferi]
MKKLLLSLISIFTLGTMFAHSASYQNSAIEFIEHADFIGASESYNSLCFLNLELNDDLFQDESFKISPNPSKNKLNIKLPRTSDNMILEVFDVLGKRIHKSTITQLEASVDVSGWKTGVYLVKVSDENESQTKRFIKQ